MTPRSARLGGAADLKRPTLLLVSAAGRLITGQVIVDDVARA
jgi:hypothetical protein